MLLHSTYEGKLLRSSTSVLISILSVSFYFFLQSPLQPPDKNFDLRGSSLDFDPDIQSLPTAPASTPPPAPPPASAQARRRSPFNNNGNNSSSSSQNNSFGKEPHLKQDCQSSPGDCSPHDHTPRHAHSVPHTLSSNSSTDSIQNGKESPDSPGDHSNQQSHSNSHTHSHSLSRSHHSPFPSRSDLRNSEDHDQGHNGRSTTTHALPGQHQQHHSDNNINHSNNSNTTSISTPPEPPNQRAIAVVLASIKV